MTWPGIRDWVFSARTFASAMLALYIAFSLDLPRPYWAMATAYIVAQPLTGAMRSKGVYRFCGTLLGAVAAVALVPNLSQAPELLVAAMALWTGVCLYFALLDRTPRSYVFMLAGYTAAIIGFPSVADPGAIFGTALARFEEITLGIVCTTVIGGVVFPRPVGPVVGARIEAWLLHAGEWSLAALSGQGEDAAIRATRRQLAADAVEIDMLASHLAFDTSNQQRATRWVRALRRRMLMLLPILSSVADRVCALKRGGALTPDLARLLGDVAGWVQRGDAAAEAGRLRAAIAALEPAAGAGADWDAMLLVSLLIRLRELVDVLEDCRALQRHLAAGGAGRPPRLRFREEQGAGPSRHRDHGMAVLSGISAALAIVVICVFWIASAWPDGAVAAEMAAVACCFFAAQDDPAPAILNFLYYSIVAVAIDAVLLFAVLPLVHGFDMLVLAMAPLFLALGVLIAMPATFTIGMSVAANGATLLGLQGTYSADFASFLASAVALVVGMGVAVSVTRIVRSVGAEWSARRVLRAGWADLAAAASRPGRADRAALAGLLLDRLGLVVPRLAIAAPGADGAAADALAELRIGLNVVDLQRDRRKLPEAAGAKIGLVLDGLASHFGARAAGRPAGARGMLLPRLDAALEAVASCPARRQRAILLELVGIRRGLFPDAPPYAPQPSPGPLPSAAPVLERAA